MGNQFLEFTNSFRVYLYIWVSVIFWTLICTSVWIPTCWCNEFPFVLRFGPFRGYGCVTSGPVGRSLRDSTLSADSSAVWCFPSPGSGRVCSPMQGTTPAWHTDATISVFWPPGQKAVSTYFILSLSQYIFASPSISFRNACLMASAPPLCAHWRGMSLVNHTICEGFIKIMFLKFFDLTFPATWLFLSEIFHLAAFRAIPLQRSPLETDRTGIQLLLRLPGRCVLLDRTLCFWTPWAASFLGPAQNQPDHFLHVSYFLPPPDLSFKTQTGGFFKKRPLACHSVIR